MSVFDPTNPANSIDAPESTIENQSTTTSQPAEAGIEPADESSSDAGGSGRRILIGSQRDPVAYRARQRRDWTPIEEGRGTRDEGRAKTPRPSSRGTAGEQPLALPPTQIAAEIAAALGGKFMMQEPPGKASEQPTDTPPSGQRSPLSTPQAAPTAPSAPLPVAKPSVREKFTADLEDELSLAMGGASLDDLMGGGTKTEEQLFEPHSLQSGRVVAIRRDDVFVEFSGRQQGIVSLRQFDVPPSVGAEVQVTVERLNPEDGLYELAVPNKAVQVDDWSDLIEGALIEVRVTGHNTGGLECEVNHIRGFIPVSQIALYRVEDLTQFVDQRLACLITESDPDRRNLVLSRRAVLEREREQAKQQLLATLAPGQVCDGVVRKLMDFGAFVDIGDGVDGLIHISQLAWGRVKHPSDVLHEGQTVKVRVEKIDPETGKIGLSYRDLQESPWASATMKYPPNAVARGTVTKLMDFGAFVELEPGVEGLVHISELSHKRVFRCSDVVKEGEQVEVMVRSIDPDSRRMSLSMKELSAPPEPVKKEGDSPAEASPTKKQPSKPTGPLIGGLGRKTGERFGLKW